MRDRRLVGLGDLAVHLDNVLNTIRGYFDDLISIGVTGMAGIIVYILTKCSAVCCKDPPPQLEREPTYLQNVLAMRTVYRLSCGLCQAHVAS